VDSGAAGRVSLKTIQAVVGLVAGLTSIGGATYSALGFFRGGARGEIVAIVRDAGSAQPVRDAVVEILTPASGLVATVPPGPDGVARRAVAPGAYRVRVAHPAYVPIDRDVQVTPDGVAEMQVLLEPRPRTARVVDPPAEPRPSGRQARGPARAVDRGVAVTRRVLSQLGL
jgi:hypothetical protein